MYYNFHMYLFAWFGELEAICKSLDQALAQWKNMAVHEYKIVKIAKIQDLQKLLSPHSNSIRCILVFYMHFCVVTKCSKNDRPFWSSISLPGKKL